MASVFVGVVTICASGRVFVLDPPPSTATSGPFSLYAIDRPPRGCGGLIPPVQMLVGYSSSRPPPPGNLSRSFIFHRKDPFQDKLSIHYGLPLFSSMLPWKNYPSSFFIHAFSFLRFFNVFPGYFSPLPLYGFSSPNFRGSAFLSFIKVKQNSPLSLFRVSFAPFPPPRQQFFFLVFAFPIPGRFFSAVGCIP